MTNLATWQRTDIVDWYRTFAEPFGAEEVIFSIARQEFPELSMLDIGVGAGRTTMAFASRCADYLGVDYSQQMVEACQAAFPYKFLCADARDLSAIPDKSVDYALFSFNGIDCVAYEDRIRVFSEIQRVCRGYFAFSTHNLNFAPALFEWKPSGKFHRYLARWFVLRAVNFPLGQKLGSEYAMLNDGAHRFSLRMCYIRPDRQIRDLEAAGFKDIRTFSRTDGVELTGTAHREPHPYFMCRVP